jgi:uncharacterized protein (TIGR02117 family)
MAFAALLLIALGIAGCAGPVVATPPVPDATGGPLTDVWVVRHAWHTRVAMRRADFDVASWPESRDVGEATYLEVGWGDRDFYPASDPSVWDAIDTVIRATPAALHVVARDAAPPVMPGDEHVVRLSVPAAGIDRLARFIRAHYERDGTGRATRIGPGHHPRSAFYRAAGRYHALANNSNAWTAAALRAAGVAMDPTAVVTAGAVMRQAAEIAARRSTPRPGHP